MKLLLQFIALSVLCLVGSLQAKPVNLASNQDVVNLATYLEYNRTEQDLDQPPTEGWASWSDEVLNLGFDDSVHWVRFNIHNDSPLAQNRLLQIDYPLLDELVLYTLEDGVVVQSQMLGDAQPYRERPFLDASFVLPIYFEPTQQLEFYLAFRTSGLAKAPLYLWRAEAFQSEQSSGRTLNGMFIGLVLSGGILALILAGLSRQIEPLLDAGFILSLLMITLTIDGTAFRYLWPNWPELQQHSVFLFSCFAAFFSALLAYRNLQLVYFDHPIIKLFKYLSVVSLALIPLSFMLNHKVATYFITFTAIALCVAHVYTGVKSWRDGLHEQQELNIGLVGLLLALSLISLNNFTPLNLPVTNLTMLQAALGLIVVLVALGLLGHHPSVQSRAEFDDDKSSLESELSAQNFALQETLRELEDKNRELEKLNTMDALSGIHNRRHFDKRILAELRRARRELTHLSLVMFDIDHFKAVNDNYGHLAGDEVIRTVALTAADLLQRSADEAFRYGGEEFALVLPATDSQGAYQLAEKIRQEIEAEQIQTPAGVINCTVSMGVVCTAQAQVFNAPEFIELADKALYQAKRQGRNQVIQYLSEDVLNGTS